MNPSQSTPSATPELTPKQIVAELDKYIVGQHNAKKSVAIALRNRWRRQQIGSAMREEIMPNNIIMIGATGVGKTEIARRLAKLAHAPFLKVEATKFTEVGYVGRDVESIVRDLMELGISMVRAEHATRLNERAQEQVEERLLDILQPPPQQQINFPFMVPGMQAPTMTHSDPAQYQRDREEIRRRLRVGELEEFQIEMDVVDESYNSQMGLFF